MDSALVLRGLVKPSDPTGYQGPSPYLVSSGCDLLGHSGRTDEMQKIPTLKQTARGTHERGGLSYESRIGGKVVVKKFVWLSCPEAFLSKEERAVGIPQGA